jgi:glyoxylase-like metal-dependent hydrolase (beta-lactamase superfamily II)
MMSLTVLKFITGPIQTNTYLVYNENKKCFIVDPSSGCNKLVELVKKETIDIESIVITHAHFDHIMGIPEILDISPDAAIYVHPREKIMLKNAELNSSVLIGENFTYQGNTIDLVEGEMAIEVSMQRSLRSRTLTLWNRFIHRKVSFLWRYTFCRFYWQN